MYWTAIFLIQLYLDYLILASFLKQYKYFLSTEFHLNILREMVIFVTDLWSNLYFVWGDEGKRFSHGYQHFLTSFREYLVMLPWEKLCLWIKLPWLNFYYVDIIKICFPFKKKTLPLSTLGEMSLKFGCSINSSDPVAL